MDLKAKLAKLKAPYFHLAVIEMENFQRFIKSFHNEKVLVRCINGNNCATADKLFVEFSEALNFPDYYGRNWMALDECLNDLEWLPADAYILLFSDFFKPMVALEGDFYILIDILIRTANEWVKGRNYDEYTTKPTPFHVVFECSKKELNAMKSKLDIAGVKDIDLIFDIK